MTTAAHSPAGDAPTRIVARNLHRLYQLAAHRVAALRGASIEISEPGFHAIMGPSGSGKTTLLHLLAALDRPDEGEIEIAGTRLSTLGERELTMFRRRRIGIVFQQFNLLPTMTALDNAALPGLLDGVSRGEREARAMALLTRLGLAERADHSPDALSGGEQQRVAIARALYFSPPVLFADEPTGSLDSRSGAELWNLLREIASDGNTIVLMVTHEPEAAINCRRVHLLRDGRVSDQFDVEGMDLAELAARAQQPDRAT